jgi:transposase
MDYDEGMRAAELIVRYRVSKSWIYKLIAQRRDLGHIDPLKGIMGRPPRLREHTEQLQRLVADHPDATLEELRAKLDIRVGVSTLCRALQALKLTLKKSHSCG